MRRYSRVRMTVANCGGDLEEKLVNIAEDLQQNFYEICSDWIEFKKDERAYLRDWIGYGLFGPPVYDEAEQQIALLSKAPHFNYKEPKKNEQIDNIFGKVLRCGTSDEKEDDVLCGVIYNIIFNTEEAKKKPAEMQQQVYPVPVFKVKAKDGKIYFIDTAGRIYNGFDNYVKDNTMPACKMVLPKDGLYQANPNLSLLLNGLEYEGDVYTRVWTETFESPASSLKAKLLAGGDVASMVVTVASLGVGVASMLTPVGPAVAVAGVVGSSLGGLWATGRSVQQLADRSIHGESISPTDREALSAWIAIAGSTVGIAATGGSALIVRAARAGATVSKTAMVVHDAVQIGNLIINGVGITFKTYDIYAHYSETSQISTMDVFYLAAHTFFFCSSVMNVTLAKDVIQATQGRYFKEFEESLRSNRHRKAYKKLIRDTKAGASGGSTEEIIRSLNKIENKDEFFQAMVRNRKPLSASGAKASITPDGRITVNGIMTIDPVEFSTLPKNVRTDVIKNIKPGPTSTSGAAASGTHMSSGTVSTNSFKSFEENRKMGASLKDFCSKHSIGLLQNASVTIGDFSGLLSDLQNVNNKVEIFVSLLNMGYRILIELPRHVSTVGDTLAYIVTFLWDLIKANLRRLKPGHFIEDKAVQDLLKHLIPILHDRMEAKIDDWVESFTKWLKQEFPQVINPSLLIQQQNN